MMAYFNRIINIIVYYIYSQISKKQLRYTNDLHKTIVSLCKHQFYANQILNIMIFNTTHFVYY
jgi:hypothetical protein